MVATLTGSEKQVAWAEKIRATMLSEMQDFIESFMVAGRKAGHTDDVLRAAPAYVAITAALAKIEAQTSASWWIDRRSEYPRDLLKSMR
jgi:hypothetical protein